ncbi:murein biosynthesis integral membrane protein MurJ [Patescibacteria group bacterium]|nr:murein biosynthesis integral membrane protein MurJ [Patescibacteria group bacterium]
MEAIITRKNLITKSVGLLAVLALIKAVFGLGKDLAIAHYFGASWQADVILAVLSVVMVLFWTLGNALESAFIPEYLKRSIIGQEEARRKSTSFFISVLIVTLLITLALIMLAPFYTRLLFPGFSDQAISLATNLLRGFLGLLVLQTLFLVLKGFYHAERNFIKPAVIAIISSLVIIAMVIIFQKQLGVYSVMWGFIIGSLIQISLLIKKGINRGLNIKQLVNDWPWIKKIWRLALPLFIATLFIQFNFVVDRIIASNLVTGSISSLTYSFRVIQLPLDLFGVALFTVMLPILASSAVFVNFDQYKKDFSLALNLIFILMIPLTVLLMFFAQPVIQIIFQRGAFDQAASLQTTSALIFYLFGLVFMTMTFLTERALQSLQKVKVFLYINMFTFLLNIGLDIWLSKIWGVKGIALATSLIYAVSVVWQLQILRKEIPNLLNRNIFRILGKVILSSLIMLSVLFLINSGLFDFGTTNLNGLVRLLIQILLSLAVYYFTLRLLKVDLIKLVKQRI